MQNVLTIAGYDPSSGAGVTADLMVFAAHGLFGISCITALTVQSTVGVREISPVPARMIADTLDCLESDLPPAGIKIGMLGDASAVVAVAAFLRTLRLRRPGIPVVLDPVLRSSSGTELLDGPGLESLRRDLLSHIDWITPNLDELATLVGGPELRREDVPEAARSLQDAGRRLNVLVTGGHLPEPDDLLFPYQGDPVWLHGTRVEGTSTHGTGCAFSSALVSRLTLNDDPLTAARAAKSYVAEAMRRSVPRGKGRGPMNHLWPLQI